MIIRREVCDDACEDPLHLRDLVATHRSGLVDHEDNLLVKSRGPEFFDRWREDMHQVALSARFVEEHLAA